MTPLSAAYRTGNLQQLHNKHFDLCIIGGGITGAGIALDAAARGLKAILIEQHDFASGTSSRSTKLIHGGLRYLKQLEFFLVRDVGRERAIVHRLAPHLVHPEKMLLPFIKSGTFGKFTTSLGLWLYDLLAGVRGKDRRKMLSLKKTLRYEPLLNKDSVLGGGLYAEYRTDDARLTMELIKTASEKGAVCLNYVKGSDFVYENSKITAVECTDTLVNQTYTIHSDIFINAAGPWVDELRKLDNSLEKKHLFLTKGVHIVVPNEKLPLRQAIYFDVAGGRMIFAIPRQQVTYIGTTDTPYTGDKSRIRIDPEDIQYLLDAVNGMFPTIMLTGEDVISCWAGLRPLIYEEGKSASELSRKDEIFVSSSGLISIAGGKLTGYRKMAEKVVDMVLRTLKKKVVPCPTRKISLTGGYFKNYRAVKRFKTSLSSKLKQYESPVRMVDYLVDNYGRNGTLILEMMAGFENPHPVNLIRAELRYCLGNELVLTLPDFFIRRTGRLFFDPGSIPAVLEIVANDAQEKLGWTAERKEQEIETMREIYEKRKQWC